MKKHFNEYFAKVVLESCFPQKFDILEISDKPDLRHPGSNTGIEVTYSMPKKEAEAVNVWHRIHKGKSKNIERDIERLSQLGIEYDSKSFVWNQGCYDENIKEGPIKEFFDAVAQKVERLNSKTAQYAEMAHYELFVNSTILIPDEQILAVIRMLKEINSRDKKFETIYLITIEQKLYIFDMVKEGLHIKYLYNHLNLMADKAKQLLID